MSGLVRAPIRVSLPVLATCFTVASREHCAYRASGLAAALLFVMVFISGFGVTGGQAGVNALTGTYYPTMLRSTGLGRGIGDRAHRVHCGAGVGRRSARPPLDDQQLFYAAARARANFRVRIMIAMRWVLRPKTISTGAQSEVVLP